MINVDPIGQQMTVDWIINYECESIGCPDVNVYFDSYVLTAVAQSFGVAYRYYTGTH